MTAEDFQKCCEWLERQGLDVEAAKRPAYTHQDADVLRNFKEGAMVTATSWLQYWAAHLHKHLSTVVSFGRNPNTPQAEPMDSRWADLRNYVRLGCALWADTIKQNTGRYPWEDK